MAKRIRTNGLWWHLVLWKGSSSWSTNGTRRITLVTNPLISLA